MSRSVPLPPRRNKTRTLLSPVALKSVGALLLGACSPSKAEPNYDYGLDGGFNGFPDREPTAEPSATPSPAEPTDAGLPDAGLPDAGLPDAGLPDASTDGG